MICSSFQGRPASTMCGRLKWLDGVSKEVYCKSSSDDATTSCDHAINNQNDNGAHHGANKSRPLAWSIPTERLAQKRCNERSYNAQNGGENEASWLVISRHDELCDDAGYKANNDC